MADILLALASIAIVGVMALYLMQVINGKSTPNPATWLIWFVVGTMNTITYMRVAEGDVFQWLVTLLSTGGLTLIFLYALINGKFAKIERTEVVCGALAVLVGAFWQTTGDPVVTNMLLQGIFVISFYPTVTGLVRGTLREDWKPWTLAVVAYSLMTAGVTIGVANGGHWHELVHPIVNGILGNGSVLVTIWWMKRKP